MLYRLYQQSSETRIYTEPFSQCKIPYLPTKRMRERYPDGAFTVIGEIGCSAKPCAGQDRLLADSKTKIPVFPRGSLFPPFEWVAGYVQVGENTYVAVVKSMFPSFLFRRNRRQRHN